MTYNPDIHNRHSIRLRGYDYASGGAYFVTLCTFQRECRFGEVVDGGLRLNEVGIAADACWRTITRHFPHVRLDEFVVMPNHLHAVLHIAESEGALVGAKQGASASPDFGVDGSKGDGNNKGEAGESFASPLQSLKPIPRGTKAGSLGALIQNYKSVSTRNINKIRNNHGVPVWQRNYYEHVIRDEDDLRNIRRYIAENPLKWDLDENNPANAENR